MIDNVLTHVKGLTTRVADAMLAASERGSFDSMANFFHRVAPGGEELEAMTKNELREHADVQGVTLGALDSKGTIVDKILGEYVPPKGLALSVSGIDSFRIVTWDF